MSPAPSNTPTTPERDLVTQAAPGLALAVVPPAKGSSVRRPHAARVEGTGADGRERVAAEDHCRDTAVRESAAVAELSVTVPTPAVGRPPGIDPARVISPGVERYE